jgi:hypothetical protein
MDDSRNTVIQPRITREDTTVKRHVHLGHRTATAVLAVSLALLTVPAAASTGGGALEIEVLSSRTDAVTGGDALVRIDVPRKADPRRVTVRLDGRDVSRAFVVGSDGLTAVLDGLTPGKHTLAATARRARPDVIRITAYPGTGPVFSGPHQQPFHCETAEFRTVTGDTLGEPLDAACSVATRIDYVYRATDGQFRPLPDRNLLPANVAYTTTLDGVQTPFVVRVQTGTINRGVYEIAVLHDPRGGSAPSPFHSNRAWNGRLIYTLGGGCRGGWHRQGPNTGSVLQDPMLSRGFAVASNSLNVFANNCNDLLTSETLSMTREEFIEGYGLPRYTMGWGCSGGSYQAQQAADNYPGLLDGIVVGCSFPDVGFATSQKLADSRLLHEYFVANPDAMTEPQELAVSGFRVHASIASMSDGAKRLDPVAEFDASVPVADRYHPLSNPFGARATVWDHARNAFGIDAATGFARRPLDNVGVQYGLNALRGGLITVDQFLDINQRIGGLDIDGKVAPQRMAADPQARRAAYLTGRMLDGGGGLRDIPIIDHRGYADARPAGDIHQRYHSFSTRERLIEANGDADNQVLLTESTRYGLFVLTSPIVVEAMLQMDRWILAAQADRSSRRTHDVVVTSKPADLVDACFTVTDEKIVERQVYEGATRCNELYPAYASPRLVAGGPLTNDVITCQRRAPVRSDYPQMSHAQWALLRTVFATGVCDYRRPGVDETGIGGTWAFFTSPGTWSFHESRR